jgi:NAD(P)H-dependent flavin oxidoreductase YrpB (nitropropane dioxygenase family)
LSIVRGVVLTTQSEAPIHNNVKEAIVKATEDDTELVLRRWRNTTRLFKNKVAVEAKKIETTSTTGEFSEVQPLVSGKRGREVFINGDVDFGVWTAGTCIGAIKDIPTCAELVGRIEKEAEAAISKMHRLVVPTSKL